MEEEKQRIQVRWERSTGGIRKTAHTKFSAGILSLPRNHTFQSGRWSAGSPATTFTGHLSAQTFTVPRNLEELQNSFLVSLTGVDFKRT